MRLKNASKMKLKKKAERAEKKLEKAKKKKMVWINLSFWVALFLLQINYWSND